MLFPLTLYVCLLGLAWAFWRRRGILDRNEVLFGYLLLIGGTWTAVLISLIPSQEYASAYGQQVLVFSSFGAIIVGAVGILVHALWPPRPSSSIQEVRPPETVPVALNAQKLRALSPIHMMIMAIERASPKKDSFGPAAGSGIGCFVRFDDVPNLDEVRSTCPKYADVLGSHLWNKWLDFDEHIRKQMKEHPEKGGFWMGKREWKWLLEFEREYQDARNVSLPQTAPEIEVKISPPLIREPRQLEYLLQKKVPPLQIYLCQWLTIKATTTKVNSLTAKTWIDDEGPYCLNWAPKASEPTSENRKRVDLFREEEVQLPIWYVARLLHGPEKGYPIWLTVVSDDVFRSVELDRLEKPTIDIAIQFIGDNYTDPKPRHFKLSAKPDADTWDEICLTEGH
jgi:hypothetical protein